MQLTRPDSRSFWSDNTVKRWLQSRGLIKSDAQVTADECVGRSVGAGLIDQGAVEDRRELLLAP